MEYRIIDVVLSLGDKLVPVRFQHPRSSPDGRNGSGDS